MRLLLLSSLLLSYEYMKIIYVNCGVKNLMKDDHRSYIRNLCSCENDFFFRLSFRNCKSCVYNCDDHPSFNSSLRSSHTCFSYIHNFLTFLCLLPFKYIADKFQALRWYWKRGWGDEFFVTVIFLLSPIIGAFYL